MIPSKHYLLYAQMHTRKYTTATYKPSNSIRKLAEERCVDFAKQGVACVSSPREYEDFALTTVQEGALETRYVTDITFTIHDSETNEVRTLTMPREKVTVIKNLIPRDAPYVYITRNEETNEEKYEIHVGTLQDSIGRAGGREINLLHPVKEN